MPAFLHHQIIFGCEMQGSRRIAGWILIWGTRVRYGQVRFGGNTLALHLMHRPLNLQGWATRCGNGALANLQPPNPIFLTRKGAILSFRQKPPPMLPL